MDNLNKKQRAAINLIKLGSNVLVTGAAGVGKSYLVSEIIGEFTDFHITSSTGISAVNIGGRTIHSWAGIGIAIGTKEQIYNELSKRKHVVLKIRKAKRLILDEISMIDADLLDKIEYVLRRIKGNHKPFGGIQMVFFGDYLQLPPVSREGEEEKRFSFEAESFNNSNVKIIELTEVIRQSDESFIKALHKIRMGNVDQPTKDLFNSRLGKKPSKDILATHLMTHNYMVDRVNDKKLAAINLPSKNFKWSKGGADAALNMLEKSCPALETLELKIGAQVICLKNIDPAKEIANGSVGKVTGWSADGPIVKFNNGEEISIKKALWEIKEFKGDKQVVTAWIEQFPLKLGWASSIHKAQGQTIDHAVINLKSCFECGQAYVGLSRIKNLNGIYLEDIDWDKVIAHPKAVEFYENLNK